MLDWTGMIYWDKKLNLSHSLMTKRTLATLIVSPLQCCCFFKTIAKYTEWCLQSLLFIFLARVERYNHSLESDEDEEQTPLDFGFSTCSPRYSRINSPSPLASSPVSPVSQDMFSDLKSSDKTIRRTYSESSNSPPTVRRRSKTESNINSFRGRYRTKLLFITIAYCK